MIQVVDASPQELWTIFSDKISGCKKSYSLLSEFVVRWSKTGWQEKTKLEMGSRNTVPQKESQHTSVSCIEVFTAILLEASTTRDSCLAALQKQNHCRNAWSTQENIRFLCFIDFFWFQNLETQMPKQNGQNSRLCPQAVKKRNVYRIFQELAIRRECVWNIKHVPWCSCCSQHAVIHVLDGLGPQLC